MDPRLRGDDMDPRFREDDMDPRFREDDMDPTAFAGMTPNLKLLFKV